VAVQQQLQLQQRIMRRPQGSQRFFVGHCAFVCCLAHGGEGRLLATGQEGKAALIRVWDFRSDQQQQAADNVPAEGKPPVSNNGTCLAVLCGKCVAYVFQRSVHARITRLLINLGAWYPYVQSMRTRHTLAAL
jgi:hypothetical protein